MDGYSGVTDAASRWAFFKLIFDFLDDEITTFRYNVMGEMLVWMTMLALLATTLWILIQGYLIVSGRSRESMMGLVVSSMRAAFIVSLATTIAWGSGSVYDLLSDAMPKKVNELVTGSDEEPQDNIDENLTIMEASMLALDTLQTGDLSAIKEDADRAKWMTGVGVAGPSIVAGSMMLLYKIALALFVGFGPLFILCLLFEQSKSLFSKWLLYGLGTMFSFSVLCFMVSVATKIVGAAAAAFAVQYALAMTNPDTSAEGVSSMAMQQGGIGLVLTTLILTAPPMAAMFFQGTLGSFSAYSTMGAHLNTAPPSHQQQGGSYRPQQPEREGVGRSEQASGAVTKPLVMGTSSDNVKSSGHMGANKS